MQRAVKVKHHSISATGYWLLTTVYLLIYALAACASVNAAARPTSVAVLDFGDTVTGRRMADKVALALASDAALLLTDREESRAAARGAGYAGSLNMTLEEARDLGAAIGSDFYLTGDAQTLRRSPSTGHVFYEAYASIFIVSARTGRLIIWDRPSFEAGTREEAERALLAELGRRAVAQYTAAIHAAEEQERQARALSTAHGAPVIEEVPEEESPAARGLRPPAPYRRLRPSYPETASRAEAEGVVDVLVDIEASGEVSRVEVVRWAGFGLDEATVQTIRQMHFRPAMRDGQPVPMRALLRYNFRRPAREIKR
ncbi:MAG TPA: energy transducer TonB [Pyrinomonadaceae bacterium]